jgi:hypothetical protein
MRGNQGMAAEDQRFELKISEFLFRLTTESLRVRSNEILRLLSVGELVDHLLAQNDNDDAGSDAALLRDHLRTIPSNGAVALAMVLGDASASRLREMRRILSDRLKQPVSYADTISILMFEYIASKKAISVLQKLGVLSDRAPH